MKKFKLKKYLRNGLIAGLLLVSWHFVWAAEPEERYQTADIYYNEACGDCNQYLTQELVPYLQGQGMTVKLFDYLNDRQVRRDLNSLQDKFNIPYELQSHIMTFLDDGRVIIGGHVPLARVREAIATKQLPQPMLIFQDQMLGMSGIQIKDVKYAVWQPGMAAQMYGLDEPLTTYLNSWQKQELFPSQNKQRSLLPLVLSTGLLDGINPCAFAVLLFFIAFLFTFKGSLKLIALYGSLYIGIIYLTYLGIGLGLFKAIVLSNEPHLMAKIGAWLIIVLGGINIIGYYLPRFPIKLQIPHFSQGALQRWLTKGTLSAVIVGAFLVGLCTFPCSGGIYVAIIGLLASRNNFWQGFGYLLLYNVMFVLPLIVLLAFVGNHYALSRIAAWQADAAKTWKLWLGVAAVAVGIIILMWFV
ncbi:MAG: cytochrome c biogenesis protein CcdA [Patescibacteria group bacterium]